MSADHANQLSIVSPRSPVAKARAKVATLCRQKADPTMIAAARRDLRFEILAEQILRAISATICPGSGVDDFTTNQRELLHRVLDVLSDSMDKSMEHHNLPAIGVVLDAVEPDGDGLHREPDALDQALDMLDAYRLGQTNAVR